MNQEKTRDCPICRNRGLITTDTGQEECVCQAVARMDRYLTEFLVKRDISVLVESKLLAPLKAGQSLLIECGDDLPVFKAHFKTALIRRQDVTKTWTIKAPNEILDICFGSDEGATKGKLDIYGADLLVINAQVWPFFEKAGQQHDYVMGQRTGTGRATWILVKSKKQFLETRGHAITPQFAATINALPSVRLVRSEAVVVPRKRTGQTVNLTPGLGEAGVVVASIAPEVEERIQHLKEKFSGRQKDDADNFDDIKP